MSANYNHESVHHSPPSVGGWLAALGITPTEAIRLLYRQIAMRGEFPVELRIPNVETAAVLAKADRGEDIETSDNTADLYASWD
ncbi:MAG: type II toxin-antitoxin system RelB/DinJ family antitoxin [Akkermansiaceae bacterium]|nr:type II toxin-antitoxin system RelB/DinJ family antitoxin [Akkermansiaceae bacterium]